MTLLTCVCKCVTSKTTSFVDHRELRVTTCFELGEWQVAARSLVMAATAKISYVANRTGRAIERRVFPVNIVFPPRRVRHGHHDLVTGHALLLAHRGGGDIQVTNETRRA